MRGISGLVVTLAVLTTFSTAQVESSNAQPSTPALNANVEMVLVPTVVTDKSGQHVSGLKAADFSLLQDKKKTPRIAFIEEITHTSQSVAQPQLTTLPPGVFSNVTSNTPRPKNLIVIAIDTINTPFSEQVFARKGIIKYLSESVSPDSLVALLFMTPGGVRMLHDFTTDTGTLIAALQRVTKGNGKAGIDLAFPKAANIAAMDSETAQLAKFELDGYVQNGLLGGNRISGNEINLAHRNAVLDTTASLTQIANIYAGVPGRKALIWVTSGLPLSIEFALNAFSQNGTSRKTHETDVSEDFERSWKALNDASFAVYAVDAGGLFVGRTYSGKITPGGSVWGGGSAKNHHTANDVIPDFVHQETFNTLLTISNMTGGRAYTNTNDLAKGIRSATNDSENYYLVGFYLDSQTATPGWHPLKVSVDRKDVSVRSREGFFVSRTPVTSTEHERADLMLAMRSPVQFSGLALMLRWQPLTKTPLASTSDSAANQPAPQAGIKKHIAFELVLASNAIQISEADSRAIRVVILGVAQNAAGENVATLQQVINRKVSLEEAANLRQNGLLYKGTLELNPGVYTVHLAVRDNLSGKLGSIITPLKVE